MIMVPLLRGIVGRAASDSGIIDDDVWGYEDRFSRPQNLSLSSSSTGFTMACAVL